jgi:hypothetical protein
MSELRSALDELAAVDLRGLSDEGLAGFLDEVERAGRILEAARGRALAEIERRKTYASDGHLSSAAWLAHRQGISRRSAEGAVRRALALEQMPQVARALFQGEISTSAVQVLATAQESAPEAFARSEEALVEAARTMGYGELRAVAETWRAAADSERAVLDEDERHGRRRLDLCPDPGGMLTVRAELDREDGQSLVTAIRAVMDAEVRSRNGPDPRTPTQRRADALGEICNQWLAARDRPGVGGERPHVVVTIELEALIGRSGDPRRPGGRAELADTGQITSETARRIACDAQITRVITGSGSEPLELGRRTKVVPPGLRRALWVRDRGCRFPGCGRPPGWTDAHHVQHWAEGGETSVRNLVLLCRPHHRAIHRGFGVAMVDGGPVFSRPDGTPLPERAPP